MMPPWGAPSLPRGAGGAQPPPWPFAVLPHGRLPGERPEGPSAAEGAVGASLRRLKKSFVLDPPPAVAKIPPPIPPRIPDPSLRMGGFCPQGAAGGARAPPWVEGLLERGSGHRILNAKELFSRESRGGRWIRVPHPQQTPTRLHVGVPDETWEDGGGKWGGEKAKKKKANLGKTSPTDLAGVPRWHEKGWRWLGLSPREQMPAEASTPQLDAAAGQEVEG